MPDDLAQSCADIHRRDQSTALAQDLITQGDALLEMLGSSLPPALVALRDTIQAALTSYRWMTRENSRHDRHDYDRACAICRGNVLELAEMAAVVALDLHTFGERWNGSEWVTEPKPSTNP